MLSIIIQEHNEPVSFVKKMLEQANKLNMPREVIYVTSSSEADFIEKFKPFDYNYNFDIKIIGDTDSVGAGRNTGGLNANGDLLLFMDSHVCYTPATIERLTMTMNENWDITLSPAVDPIEFPSCQKLKGGRGYGVAFGFKKGLWEWTWLPPESTTNSFNVPFVSDCCFMMTKNLLNRLQMYGGIIGDHTGNGWEVEACMRLWRLGYKSMSEPRAVVGHYFKGNYGHPGWDEHAQKGWLLSHVIGTYVNVFDDDLWNIIDKKARDTYGRAYTSALKYAVEHYTWLREMFEPLANNIDERWFLRI